MDRTVDYYVRYIVENNIVRTSTTVDGYSIYTSYSCATIKSFDKIIVVDFVRLVNQGFKIEKVEMDGRRINKNSSVCELFNE